MIEVNNLTIKYKETEAIKELNMTIVEGEKISIVGQSGCGKTSLLHTFAGLVFPYQGSVTIKGEKIIGINNKTAIILQKDGLFPWKKVEDNVYLGIINTPINEKEKCKLVHLILDELDILDQKRKYLHELSGGQRQRVAIARALIQSPSLLLMDEPTGSLDRITKEKFQDSLHELNDNHHMTSVIVTHDIEEAVYLGKRILIMKEGRIIDEIINPLYGKKKIRESIEFYEICLKVRQVMNGV